MVEFPWTRDRPAVTFTTNIYAPGGFEPTIPASERPHTYALDRAAAGIGFNCNYLIFVSSLKMVRKGDRNM